MITNLSDCALIKTRDKIAYSIGNCNLLEEIDAELDRRAPDEAEFLFGTFDGQDIFLPIEEHDSNGNLIITEVIGYDNEGGLIWL